MRKSSGALSRREMLAGAAGVLLGAASRGEAAGLRAGAAAVRITPSLTRPVYLAGYANNRIAEKVHDDLWARVLVLDDGTTRLTLVALDLVGLSNLRVRKIRQRLPNVQPENVLIACTHVHSGPDTMGLWGPNVATSGMDPLYMQRLEDRIAVAVDLAVKDLQPAGVLAGAVEVPDGFVHNSREPLQDKQLTALRVVSPEGKTISTLIHYGGHPEVNKAKLVTSDFVHYVREAVEARFGGTSLFLNGALGGMVTPRVEEHTLEEMRRVGEGVGRSAVQAAEKATPVRVLRLEITRRTVSLPLENSGFQLFLNSRILEGELKAGRMETEVWRVDLGRQITLMSIPGEILPKPALDLKSRMPGRYRMVVALGNDELGYILDPEDWNKDLYKYERSMSVGRETWPLLFKASQELLR